MAVQKLIAIAVCLQLFFSNVVVSTTEDQMMVLYSNVYSMGHREPLEHDQDDNTTVVQEVLTFNGLSTDDKEWSLTGIPSAKFWSQLENAGMFIGLQQLGQNTVTWYSTTVSNAEYSAEDEELVFEIANSTVLDSNSFHDEFVLQGNFTALIVFQCQGPCMSSNSTVDVSTARSLETYLGNATESEYGVRTLWLVSRLFANGYFRGPVYVPQPVCYPDFDLGFEYGCGNDYGYGRVSLFGYDDEYLNVMGPACNFRKFCRKCRYGGYGSLKHHGHCDEAWKSHAYNLCDYKYGSFFSILKKCFCKLTVDKLFFEKLYVHKFEPEYSYIPSTCPDECGNPEYPYYPIMTGSSYGCSGVPFWLGSY